MLGDPMTDLYRGPRSRLLPHGARPLFRSGHGEDPGLRTGTGSTAAASTARKLDFIGEVRDAKGVVQGNVRDYQEIKLKGETAGQLAKRTLAYDTGFTLPPGTYTLKFLARENETGKMGTFETKFVVPDLTTQVKYLPISSVVLSNQRQDMGTALATAEKDKKLLAANPLVQDNQKLVPSVTRVFKKDQDMFVFLQAYQPDAQTTQPLVASVSFYRGKVKAFETAPLQITEGLNAKTKAAAHPLQRAPRQASRRPLHLPGQRAGSAAQKFAFWRGPIVMLQ